MRYHIDEMPKCYICKQKMDYWVPGLDFEKHAHVSCLAKKLANESIDRLSSALEKRNEPYSCNGGMTDEEIEKINEPKWPTSR